MEIFFWRIIIFSTAYMIIGYFALWIFSFVSIVKLQKKLHESYPDEAEEILGPKTIFGINRKKGLMLLIDAKVRALANRDHSLEILRKRASISTAALILLIPVFVILWLSAAIIGNNYLNTLILVH